MKGYFKSLIFNNLPLKLLSITLAIVFWLMAKGFFGK